MTTVIEQYGRWNHWAQATALLIPFCAFFGFMLSSSLSRSRIMLGHWLALTLWSLSLGLLACTQSHLGWGLWQSSWSVPLLASYGINLALGADALSIVFLALIALLTGVLGLGMKSNFWGGMAGQQEGKQLAQPLYLLLCLLWGTLSFLTLLFLSENLVIYYLSWEFCLVPVVILGMIFNEAPRTGETSGLKSLLFYSLASSLGLLLALGLLAQEYRSLEGVWSFQWSTLLGVLSNQEMTPQVLWGRQLGFFALLLALCVKGHLFPFHGWMPGYFKRAHPLVIILLNVFLFNVATYTFLRLVPGFYIAVVKQYQWELLLFGSLGVVYGCLCCFWKQDLRQILVSLSLAHMGHFLLGFFSMDQMGLQASLIQSINHAVIAMGLCLLFFYLMQRQGQNDVSGLRGSLYQRPWWALMALIILFANTAVPGTNGFISEFLVLASSFKYNAWASLLGALGIIFSAYFTLLWIQQWIFSRSLADQVQWEQGQAPLPSVPQGGERRTFIGLAALALVIMILGLFPTALLSWVLEAMDTIYGFLAAA